MTSAPPEYNPAPGPDALKRRLTALMTAGTPAACGVYIGLSEPGQWSARHAEVTHAIARHLADGDVDSLPHFNTNPPPILRILTAASRARPDAIGDTMADLPDDLATELWRAVATRIGSASDVTGDGRRRASDLMLRLGYLRTAADLLGMAGVDEATHGFGQLRRGPQRPTGQ